MGSLREFFVFLTGHRINANTPIEELGSLVNIGAAISFASFLAGLQFGIAGWFLAIGLNSYLQTLMSLICAFIGASIVLVLDRSFIYITDTRDEANKKFTYLYLSIRIFLIVVISSLSSQFTMPLLLKSELAIHVQDMKNDRLIDAKDLYQNKYDLSAKLSTLADLEGRAEVLKNQIATLNPDLIRQRIQASQCVMDYDKKIKSSASNGLDEIATVNLYAKDKRECERLDATYRQSLRAYIAPKEVELLQIKASINQMQSDIQLSRKNIESEVAKSSQIDDLHINIVSADVLSSLIRNNPGAFSKYILLTLLQLFLELMPILLKLQAGQSPLGRRVALYSYRDKTNIQDELNKSKIDRMESNAKYFVAHSQQAMVDKELHAKSILLDAQLQGEKIKQDLESEQLQQELNELKNHSNFYARIKKQFGNKYDALPKSGVFELFTKPIAIDQNPKLRIISEEGGPNYFMKVLSTKGPIVFTAFIRAGDSVVFPMLIGPHVIKFASGVHWYGPKLLFGQHTQYSKLKQALTFSIEASQLLGHSISLKSDISKSPELEKISELDF